MNREKQENKNSRRAFLALGGVATAGAVAVPSTWIKPVINSVVLPAHAQTSACVTDTTVGGPLLGNASGATTCQQACEAEATAVSGQLCAVTETVDGSGATQCSCDIDT